MLERALRAGYRLRSVLIDAARTLPLPDAVPAGVPIYAAGPEVVLKITGMAMHRGLSASLDRGPERTPDQVLEGATRVVVLENVNNPTNLGVIARSAMGLGADALLHVRLTSDAGPVAGSPVAGSPVVGSTVVARTEGRKSPAPGQRVAFRAQPDNIFSFHPATGARLAG